MRIGRLSIHVLSGKYVVEDMVDRRASARRSAVLHRQAHCRRDGLGDGDAAGSPSS